MINDTQAKQFFAHAATLTPNHYMYTDNETPVWSDDTDIDSFDYDKMVALSNNFRWKVLGNKRKSCETCESCESCEE